MKTIQTRKIIALSAFFYVVLFSACSKDKDEATVNEDIVVFKVTGDINPRLEEFRNLLGTQLNTAPGAVGGRREINWDGVTDELLDKKLPADFFNPIGEQAVAANQRGLVYSTEGNFQVSKTSFAKVNPGAAGQLTSFSGDQLFANVSSNKWDVEFKVAGQALAASVKGFGIIFSDVDRSNSTSLEFFNGQRSLGKFFASAKNGSNFSFLGVYFKNEIVTRVRVEHDGKLDEGQNDTSDNGPVDLVAMDNFLYNEPVKN